MRKFACAAIASAFVLAAAAPNTASAMPVPVAHPAVIAGSSSTAGAWAAAASLASPLFSSVMISFAVRRAAAIFSVWAGRALLNHCLMGT